MAKVVIVKVKERFVTTVLAGHPERGCAMLAEDFWDPPRPSCD